MDRLSQGEFAPKSGNKASFGKCWICGEENRDICHFRMWQECDDFDQPEEIFIIACRDKQCQQVIKEHPRLYIELPWGCHETGKFMLVCSDCKRRSGFKCTDQRAKTNGGIGLQCEIANPFTATVCTNRGCFPMRHPVIKCEGYEE